MSDRVARRLAARNIGWELTRPSRVHTEPVGELNVLGGPLEPCGTDPMTGFYRDGCCSTGPQDVGRHTICAVVTAEFLEHQRSIGNDLSTPMPQYRFPGLEPGDRWCVTAVNWLRAYEDGCAAPVVLACTHERTLEVVGIERSAKTPSTFPTTSAAFNAIPVSTSSIRNTVCAMTDQEPAVSAGIRRTSFSRSPNPMLRSCWARPWRVRCAAN